MNVHQSQIFPVTINPSQAETLHSGFVEVGIENIEGVPDFGMFLDRIQHVGESELPTKFTETARGVAKLVLSSELEHMSALINNGRIKELNLRLNSPFGLLHKLETLAQFVD